MHLLVYPGSAGQRVLGDLLRNIEGNPSAMALEINEPLTHIRLEPEGNLLLSSLDAVGTVNDIAADVNAVLTTDGAER